MGALPYFAEQNRDLLSQDKVRIVLEDGHINPKSTDQRFDSIVSDLFVSWRASVGALYTREHFASVQNHLNPKGLFVQWLPLLYQMSEWDFAMRLPPLPKPSLMFQSGGGIFRSRLRFWAWSVRWRPLLWMKIRWMSA